MKYRDRGRRALCVVWFLLILAGPAVAWGQYESPESDSGVVFTDQHFQLDWDGLTRPRLGLNYVDQRINWSMDSLNVFHSVLQDEWTTSFHGPSKSVFLYHVVAGDTTGVPVAFDYDTYRLIRSDENTLARWRESVQSQLRLRDREKARDLVSISLPFKLPKAVQSIVGEGGAGLKVNGSKRISFSGRSQWRDGATVSLAQSQSKFPSLDMEQITQMTITGKIGSKIEVKVDQDSRRVADLGNQIQIRYKGDDDEILQTVEAGNTNLNLPRTQFVGYSQRVQGLFGVKATAKVGHLDLTAIVSQEKGSTEGATFNAGASSVQTVIRDYSYLRDRYFWLLNPYSDPRFAQYITDSARIVDDGFELYVTSHESNKHTLGLCLPNIPDTLTVEKYRNSNVIKVDNDQAVERMKVIDAEKYSLYRNSFYVRLDNDISIGPEDVLAYTMIVEFPSGARDTIGEVLPGEAPTDTVSLLLQMIRPSSPGPTHPTWNLEWKNVYNLGTGAIDQGTELTIEIYKGTATTATAISDDLNRQDNSTPYLQILGLDRVDESGARDPDLKFDAKNNLILDTQLGHLIFPNRFPFAPASYPVETGGPIVNLFGDSVTYAPDGVQLKPEVPGIYEGLTDVNRREASQYYIVRGSSQRSTEYNLGRINIIEGSEVVKLNGRQLQRGVDYNISYDLGQIRFLKDDEILDANANVTIDYEYQPFLSSARKTLFGMRGEYALGRDFKWGATALFKSEQQPDDQKPRLGEEPTRTLIWDSDLGFRTEVPLLTKLTDALPFIEATGASNLDVQAEVAQSRPNPNTRGEVFVDDFEGSQEVVPIPLLREQWSKSSPPVAGSLRDGNGGVGVVNDRGKIIWYNRFDPYRATEIYDKDEQAADDRKQVLTLKFVPDRADTLSWGGILHDLSDAAKDLSITQYLEIRTQGNKGRLVVNLGDISEDIDNDGVLDREDRPQGANERNDVLDDGEDTGLDSLFDGAEVPCDSGDIYCNPADPSGDNWFYNQNDKNNYWGINGTEGNRIDPLRGFTPDTEDIGGAGGLDRINNYFEFVINLADSLDPYLVQNSGYCDNCSNPELGDWRTFRIPINDSLLPPVQVGTPKINDIEFMRLYVTGVREFDTVQVNIADMNLVSQRWRDTRVDVDTAVGQEFRVAVINTRENSDYTSPPGVTQIVDRVTQIGQGEQSLLLRFANFQPARDTVLFDTLYTDCGSDTCPIDTIIPRNVTLADAGRVKQTLIASQDYTGYRRLQMFVHGDVKASPELEFFLRFGTDTTNYYEYHSRLQPGWAPSNHIDVDFNELTGLKFEAQKDRAFSELALVDTVGGPGNRYRVVGNPRLSRVEYLEMGVVNLDSVQVRSGEIWADELRLTDVRKDVGWAARVSVSTNFSDFISIGTSYRKQNYAFQTLTASQNNVVNSNSTEDLGLNLRVSPHKILPPSWGIQLPVTVNWGKNKTTPYLKTRSDIVVPESAREEEATVTTRKGVSVAERVTSKSGHPLVRYFLAPFQLSVAYSQTETTSPTVHRSASVGYTGTGRYNLTFQKPFSIPIFFWTKYLLVPAKLAATRLTLMPSSFQASGDASDRRSETQYTEGGTITASNTRNFRGQMSVRYMPLPGLQTDYTYNTQRDLREPGSVRFSLDPRKITLGTETSFNQKLRGSYSTRVIPFIEQRYSYDATYQESKEVQGDQTYTASLNRSIQANYGLAWVKLFGRPNDSDRWVTARVYQPVRKLVRGLFNALDPLSVSATRGEQIRGVNFKDRPAGTFRFGFNIHPQAPKASGQTRVGTSLDATSETNTYSARSGFQLMGSRVSFDYTVRDQLTVSTQSTKNYSITWPSVRFSYTDLTRFGLLKRLVNSASVETYYTKKNDYQDDLSAGKLVSHSTDVRFNPLLQLSLNFRGNVTTKIKFDHQVRTTRRPSDANSDETISTDNGVQFSLRYSFSAPGGLKLPFLSGLRLKSTMNLTTSVSWTSSQRETVGNGITSDRTTFAVSPQAGYSFSQNLTGGLKARWQDSNDKTQNQKSHVRELGFWVEFRF